MGGVAKAIGLIAAVSVAVFAIGVAIVDLPAPTRSLEEPARLEGLGG